MERVPYHFGEQRADVLLGPIRAAVAELEERSQHFLDRMPLASPDDVARLRAATEALAAARRELASVVGAAGETEGDAQPRASVAPENAAADGRKRVLITGAGGRIGTDLAERLRDRYQLRLQYRRSVPDRPPVDDWVQADIARMEEIAPAMDGIDAVIHLAGEPSVRAPWERVRDANIVGTYNVFEAARQAGVRKVVFASTNHVMGMYDREHQWPVYSSQPVRPDSLYGVSKAFGEALGRHYVDMYGLAVVCLRIGWFHDRPRDEIGRWMWLSPRDCAQVVWRAIEAELGFGTFYAISGNGGRHWDITDTIQRLGYRPEDDAERHFAEAGDRGD